MKNKKILQTAVISMLSAVAFVLYLFEFNIIPGSSYLKIDLSDIPALLGGILYGPAAAVCIEGIKNIIELAVRGIGAQMGFGNIMNFIVGCAYTVTFSLIYKRIKKENISVLVSSAASTAAILLFGLVSNYFITPWFFKAFLETELTTEVLWAAIGSATALNGIKGVMLSLVSMPLIKGAKKIGERIKK